MAKKMSQQDSVKFFQFLAKERRMKEVLVVLFTEDELDDISKRIAVLGLFYKGESQRDIAQKIDVSLSFVTRTLGRMRRVHKTVQAYAKKITQ